MKYKCYYSSPFGEIILISDSKRLVGLYFKSSKFFHKIASDKLIINEDIEVFSLTKNWLDQYFSGKSLNPKSIPIHLLGSDFCMQVWKILLEIPYGETITYGEIAKKIGEKKGIKKMSAQAVGYAVGHNPISIIVPCHRVIGSNGNLVGYSSGIDKKIELLKLEKIIN